MTTQWDTWEAKAKAMTDGQLQHAIIDCVLTSLHFEKEGKCGGRYRDEASVLRAEARRRGVVDSTVGGAIAPTISTNGTPRRQIEQQLEQVGSTLQAALTALGNASPNARDYGDSFAAAKAQHEAREAAVGQVLRDIMDIYEEITA
jgi:hypothetical protein